jgi:hypothetical protein
MTGFFWFTYVMQWLLLAVLTLLVLLLYRQYGRSILPAKDRLKLAGLDIGASVQRLQVGDQEGGAKWIPLATNGDRPAARLLMFASSACPICARLWSEVGALAAEQPDVEHWWIQSGEPKTDPPPPGWRLITDIGGLSHNAMEVPALPYAYALDADGVVRGKGLMNDLNDFRVLVDAAISDTDQSRARPVSIQSPGEIR